jgi:hypothetical protein
VRSAATGPLDEADDERLSNMVLACKLSSEVHTPTANPITIHIIILYPITIYTDMGMAKEKAVEKAPANE